MEAKFNINTSQNVNIELKIAGVGDRLLALLIDYLILVGFFILIGIVVSNIDLSSTAEIIIMSVLGFFTLLYHFFFEWLFKGQTIGKKYRKIKVIHYSGTEASVFQLLIRNLVRVVDSIYGLGLLIVFLSKKSQRLGDLAAGTLVVKNAKETNLAQTAFVNIQDNYQPVFSKIDILRLNERDMEMIKEVIERPIEKMNWSLVGTLAEGIKAKAGIDPGKRNSMELLKAVLSDFQYYNLN